jgi:hypothetical protein
VRVAWLSDKVDTVGGAEMTAREFRAVAPVEVVDVGPDELEVAARCDVVVAHNVVSYPPDTAQRLVGTRMFKYWHDTGPHLHPELAQGLYRLATPIFCSPLQAAYMGFPGAAWIPPALDLAPFRVAAENAGERRGSVTVGAWMNWGKSPERCREVAPDVEFYGFGPCSPVGTTQVDYCDIPELLARYKTFIHLPSVLEPFGRAVVEAWASGCRVVTNRLVGARHWIENEPEKLDTAGQDFWETVLA